MKYWWTIIILGVFAWSGWMPADRITWTLEVLPVVLGFFIIAMTYQTFRLTPLIYTLILIHMVVLMVGGHYTYANVPLFDWIGDVLSHTRNNYDKLGHFMQGAVPVMVAREIVIRKNVFINQNTWMNFFLVCFVLALSAFYELLEWWSAVLLGSGADEFLGTQGYAWDTQSDMAFALLGAIISLFVFSHAHNKQLKMIKDSN